MKRGLLALLSVFLALPAFAQGGPGQGNPPVLYNTLSASGGITGTASTCLGYNCIYLQLPQGAVTATAVITGTWSATLQFEVTAATNVSYNTLDAAGVTWTSLSAITANGTTNIPAGGQTWVRIRASAYASGTAVIALSGTSNPGILTPLTGQTLTTPTLTSPTITTPAITNGTADGMALGATTASSIRYTSATAAGTKFSVTGCGTATSLVGGSLAGKFVGGSGTCTPVVTTNLTAPNGYSCWIQDQTTATALFQQTANNTTTVTFTAGGTVGATDTIIFGCVEY